MIPYTPSTVTVFGDSHSMFFFPSTYFIGRLKLPSPLPYKVAGEAIPAASVAGFRPGRSTLMVKERISNALPSSTHLVLAFGQVDLELGYYFRKVVKKAHVTPESFVSSLTGIYKDFISSLKRPHCQIAIKGVNLTALDPIMFGAHYVSRIVTEGTGMSKDDGIKIMMPHMLTEDQQNAMHLDFNGQMKQWAEQEGLQYFDFIEETAEPASDPTRPRLAEQFKTASFDHHLANSVATRRIHYTALGDVFKLNHAPAEALLAAY